MVRHALKLVCLGFMTMLLASCGQTYELQSITISPTQPNIEGMTTSQALTVTAHYSNTKTEDVTAKAQYSLGSADKTMQGGLTLNNSGILETTTTPVCSWVATLNSDGTTYSYAIVLPYTATATYSTFTATAGVSVASAATCYDGIGFKKT